MTKTILLIDGDTIAYQAALAAEKYVEWGEGDEMIVSNNADVGEATASFDAAISRLCDLYGSEDYRIALTDAENFRKAILPTYKSKRGKKPMALAAVRRYAVEKLGATIKPNLEGDDVLGIWSTHPTLIKGFARKIIVSIDKDMRCVPGLLSVGDGVVEKITDADADHFHMVQTLTGDVTDGYTGLPGCGPVAAGKILDGIIMPDAAHVWQHVVAAYEKKGLTEADALVQARCARILRATDYNFKTQEPILWTPPA